MNLLSNILYSCFKNNISSNYKFSILKLKLKRNLSYNRFNKHYC